MSYSEYVKVIDDNREALLWRLRLIKNAKKSIVMIAFKMRNDNSGRDVISALIDAAERGIDINVVIDGLSSELFLQLEKETNLLVSYPNVRFQFYNTVRPGKIRKWSYRLHDKIFMIDDDIYMMGGRNILDVSIGDYSDTYNIDRDVVVIKDRQNSNGSSEQISKYIQSVFECGCLSDFRDLIQFADSEKTKELMLSRFRNLCLINPEITEEINKNEKGFMRADNVRMLYTNPVARKKKGALWKQLVDLMKEEGDVLLMTPYIICDKKMYRDLKHINNQKDNFAIITNSPKSGANHLGCVDYLNERRNIYNMGIKVYECTMENSLHAKTMLIGNSISVIGSFNLDMRSAYIDTETMLVIESEEVNAKLRESAEDLIKKSRSKEADGTFSYGEEFTDVATDPAKLVFYSGLRILVRPFRRLM